MNNNQSPEDPIIQRGGNGRESNNKLALRNTLNIIFMLAALATMIIYMALPMPQYSMLFMGIGLIAVVVKIAEVIIRYMR